MLSLRDQFLWRCQCARLRVTAGAAMRKRPESLHSDCAAFAASAFSQQSVIRVVPSLLVLTFFTGLASFYSALAPAPRIAGPALPLPPWLGFGKPSCQCTPAARPSPAPSRSPQPSGSNASAPSSLYGCSGRGTLLFDACVCDPGAEGERCELGAPTPCALLQPLASRLQCFGHASFGTAKVDAATWQTAVSNEAGIWHGSSGRSDRSKEHLQGFGNFSALPQEAFLGAYAEYGCGPWTQTLNALLSARPGATFSSITLLDPNLFDYIRDVPGCTYSSGALREPPPQPGGAPGRTWPVTLVSAGAEAPLFTGAFDTLLMLNVLEHVQDALAVLHNVWGSLRRGGVVILSENAWNGFNFSAQEDLNNRLHPVRISTALLERFFAQFEQVYLKRETFCACSPRSADAGESFYFIGRKREGAGLGAPPPVWATSDRSQFFHLRDEQQRPH